MKRMRKHPFFFATVFIQQNYLKNIDFLTNKF